jgi:hypothetical protein
LKAFGKWTKTEEGKAAVENGKRKWTFGMSRGRVKLRDGWTLQLPGNFKTYNDETWPEVSFGRKGLTLGYWSERNLPLGSPEDALGWVISEYRAKDRRGYGDIVEATRWGWRYAYYQRERNGKGVQYCLYAFSVGPKSYCHLQGYADKPTSLSVAFKVWQSLRPPKMHVVANKGTFVRRTSDRV